MKWWMMLCMAVLFTFCLAGCRAKEEPDEVRDSISYEGSRAPEESLSEGTASGKQEEKDSIQESLEEADMSAEAAGNSRVLIAYFSVPEDVDTSGTDAVEGASVVVKDSEKMGNTEYVAKLIRQTIGGDLFRIETVEEYPLDHDPLVDQAADEQDEDLRPELKNHVENFGQYETVILGFAGGIIGLN